MYPFFLPHRPNCPQVSNHLQRLINLGKAGERRRQGWRPTVRGIAMNPIDHPHGGRGNGGRPSCSPWGVYKVRWPGVVEGGVCLQRSRDAVGLARGQERRHAEEAAVKRGKVRGIGEGSGTSAKGDFGERWGGLWYAMGNGAWPRVCLVIWLRRQLGSWPTACGMGHDAHSCWPLCVGAQGKRTRRRNKSSNKFILVRAGGQPIEAFVQAKKWRARAKAEKSAVGRGGAAAAKAGAGGDKKAGAAKR